MKNIHILPTEKSSRLKQNNITKKISLVNKGIDLTAYTPINIYITSDEEVKAGDWCLENSTKLLKWKMTYSFPSEMNDICKKIILTTDQDLIEDGVQAINDEFLEWFVKNPSCEEVEVVKFCKNQDDCPSCLDIYAKQGLCNIGYKIIIIPKEETNGCIGSNGVSDPKLNEVQLNQPKQETLEEAKKRILDSNYMNKNDADIFEMGAKWQAARLYDVEEVYSIVRMCLGMKESGKTDIEIGACLERYRKK